MNMKTMFRPLPMSMAAVALCCATMIGTPARALGQDTPPPARQGRGMGMDPKAQLDMMSTQLNLTDEQKPKVQAILEDRQKQMTALRADTTIAPEDRRPKMMAIMQGSNDKIKALLTDDQKTKFDAMMAQMRGGRGGQGGGQGAPPPPPPQ